MVGAPRLSVLLMRFEFGNKLEMRGALLSGGLNFKLDKVEEFTFGMMLWCSEVPFKSVFLTADKDTMVSDSMSLKDGSDYRLSESSFIRSFNEWELPSIDSFLALLYSVKVRGSGDDKMVWDSANNKTFSVRSCYNGEFFCLLVPSKAI